MKKIAVFIANGTEEMEFITPVDVLRRSGAEVITVSLSGVTPTCSHGVKIVADELIEYFDFTGFDGVVIPGGMPGATNLSNNQKVIDSVKFMLDNNRVVASICASPAVVLAKHNLIDGKRATCFPAEDFISLMKNTVYTAEGVTVDKNLITANGPKSALEFSVEIAKVLGLEPKI